MIVVKSEIQQFYAVGESGKIIGGKKDDCDKFRPFAFGRSRKTVPRRSRLTCFDADGSFILGKRSRRSHLFHFFIIKKSVGTFEFLSSDAPFAGTSYLTRKTIFLKVLFFMAQRHISADPLRCNMTCHIIRPLGFL